MTENANNTTEVTHAAEPIHEGGTSNNDNVAAAMALLDAIPEDSGEASAASEAGKDDKPLAKGAKPEKPPEDAPKNKVFAALARKRSELRAREDSFNQER